MNIQLVGVADIDKLWPRVAGDITRCLRKAPTDVGAGDVWANCRSGQWFMIVAHDDVAIHGTTVWRFANGYFECLVLAGSDLSRWLYDLVETAPAWQNSMAAVGSLPPGAPVSRPFSRSTSRRRKPSGLPTHWSLAHASINDQFPDHLDAYDAGLRQGPLQGHL
jgi:hypothetical protein